MSHAYSPLEMSSMLFLGVGPVDRCVVAVLARVIPVHAVVRPGAVLLTNRHCQLGGKGMGIECPYLVVGVQAWERMDSQVHDVGNLNGAAFALYVKGDRDGFGTEYCGDKRCKGT